jgi:type IV secretion system protein VirB6
MSANLDVFTKVFDRIDTTVQSTILGNTSNIMSMISPVLLSGFTVYVIFVTWSYFGSTIEQTMFDLLKRIAAWGVIISFSINVGGYNSSIVPLVMGLGEGLAQAFTGASANAGALDSLVNLLFEMTKANSEAADAVTGIEGVSEKLSVFFYNIIIIIIFGIFLIIAAAYIVLAKVFLSILVVLGPLFISLALFPATRQFFSAWVNQVVNYNLYFLLINIVGAIFISYMNATFDQTTLLSDAGVIHLIFVCLFFAVILLKLPEMASGLAGGIAANGFGALSSTISSSQRMFSGGGKSGGGKSSSQSKSSNTMKPEKTGN